MDSQQLQQCLEAVLLAAGEALSVERIQQLFDEDDMPSTKDLKQVLTEMENQYADRGFILKKVASGYVFQAKQDYAHWIARLWEEKAPRYSRAFLETLVIIAYRQPVTRGEIEDIRGVAVSSSIVRTMLEREWIKVLGYRDVPGKPAILGTTKGFLDYFNLENLNDLPTLDEIKDMDKLVEQLELEVGAGTEQPGVEDVVAEQAVEVEDVVAEQAIDVEDVAAEQVIDVEDVVAELAIDVEDVVAEQAIDVEDVVAEQAIEVEDVVAEQATVATECLIGAEEPMSTELNELELQTNE